MSDSGPIDSLVVVLAAVAIVLAVAGAVGALTSGPAALASRNHWGVPRWAPAGMSMILAAMSLATWCRDRIFQWLAVFLAVSGAAFSRPGLRELGIHLRLEIVALVIGCAFGVLAVTLGTEASIRRAMLGAFFAPIIAAAAVAAPNDWPVDWPAYATILVLAALSPWARWIHRRTS